MTSVNLLSPSIGYGLGINGIRVAPSSWRLDNPPLVKSVDGSVIRLKDTKPVSRRTVHNVGSPKRFEVFVSWQLSQDSMVGTNPRGAML